MEKTRNPNHLPTVTKDIGSDRLRPGAVNNAHLASTTLPGGGANPDAIQHNSLGGVTADQHHAQLHAAAHQTGADKIATGVPTGSKFLRDDFAWQTPPGTVVMISLSGQTVALSTTTFTAPGATGFNATEATIQVIAPRAGFVTALFVDLLTAQSATGSLVITLRKGGVDQTVTVTFTSADGAVAKSDVVNGFAVAAGDRIAVKIVNNATVASGQIGSISLVIQ